MPETFPDGHVATSLEAIATSAAKCRFDALPTDVVRIATHCLLDWSAVTIAATDHVTMTSLRAALGVGAGENTLLGCSQSARLEDAILINGTAGHLLDFDDVHSAVPGHVTVAIAPLVLALAEARGATGEDVIAAFVAGFEAMCAISRLLGSGHAQAGFHPTATMGSFGAAAAACRMLTASAGQTLSALAIASTQSAGLRAAFGTPAKSIQVGRSSVNGYLSAILALQGIEVPANVFAGRDGFAQTHGATPLQEFAAPREFFTRDVVFKFDASCFVTHAPIECLRRIKSQRDVSFDSVASVEIRVHPNAERICAIADPTTGLESKFSLHQTAAMTLAGIDTGDIAAFDDERSFTALAPWRQKISLVYDPTIVQTASAVAVRFTDGETIVQSANSDQPEDDLNRQEDKLVRKFELLASPYLGAGRAAAARRALLSLDSTADVGAVLRTLA